ncbi:MAG: hypothetical protein AB2724_13890 [Candidatus Thiodiazotropha sp.]
MECIFLNLPYRVVRTKMMLFSMAIILFFTACGGGGGGDSTGGDNPNTDTDVPSDTNTPPDTTTGNSNFYLFYTGSLIAVNPANPTNPITVEAGDEIVGGNGLIRYFHSGRIDNNTNTITDFTPDSLVYAKTDGHFYKISVNQSGSLTPVQISSETTAGQICSISGVGIAALQSVNDLTDINQSQLVYSFPGADGDCSTNSDNIWKMIRLGMSSSDSPIDALSPIIWLWDNDNSIGGWLVNDNGNLKRCDQNFINCGNGIAQVRNARVIPGSPFPVFGGALGLNNHLLEIDGQLFVYNGDTNTLSDAIFAIPEGEYFSGYTTDENYIYLASFSMLYRAPIDGSSTAILLGQEDPGSGIGPVIWSLNATENKLVYAYYEINETGNVGEIKTLDKSGGTPETLVTAAGANFGDVSVKGERIYYDLRELNIDISNTALIQTVIPLLAGVMDENGVIEFEAANAGWVGSTFSSTLDYEMGSQAWVIDKIVLGEITNREISGMSLRTFDTASGNELLNLGTVPNIEGLTEFNCVFSTVQDHILCLAAIEITPQPQPGSPTTQQDIFYLDVSTSGSLTRVTDTPEVSESAVLR